MNSINWTNAFIGRLKDMAPSEATKKLINTSFSSRLATGIANGHFPFIDLAHIKELEKQIPELLEKFSHCDAMILLGIGGSALGPRALQKAFYPSQDRPNHSGRSLWIADNIDADTLETWKKTLKPSKTVVVVISKSGGTIETMAQYVLLKDWLQKDLQEKWKNNVLIITDKEKGSLRAEATTESLASLPVPQYLGGRYSVLSAVGLFPSAFLGIDWQAFVRGAANVMKPLLSDKPELEKHPAFSLALWCYALSQHNYSQLIFFSYIPLWNFFGAWFGQLWAESLGKNGKGTMPIPAVGVTDQHSLQQMFLDGPKDKGCLFITAPKLDKGSQFINHVPEKLSYLKGQQFGDLLQAEATGTRMALVQNSVPLVHCLLDETNEEAGGRFMGLLMLTTMLTGWLLEINPLDQPAVELGKRLAVARLGSSEFPTEQKDLESFLAEEQKEVGSQSF